MIPSSTPMKIEKYISIDRCADGISFVCPAGGEEFVGIPYAHYSDDSRPFIEVRERGRVTRTINCDDVAEIVFAAQENPDA